MLVMPLVGHKRWFVAMAVVLSVTTVFAQSSGSDEEVSRRQLESGRAFARQGNYQEALKDFRAVAETHGTSSVADNALLEIARYYLDVAGDSRQASSAVDAILKTYPTSDSAPDAYLMAGRLALAKSHQPAELEAALANFDRVLRLFPTSEAVPRSLALQGQTLWYAGRFNEALANLGRVSLEYSSHPAAAEAYLASGRVMTSLGDPISAMEELQQVRNRWPNSPEAQIALGRITLLQRLYVRAAKGVPFVLSAETIGPAKLSGVVAMTLSPRGNLFWATDATVGASATAGEPAVPALGKPRGLVVDASGMVTVLETSTIRPLAGTAMPLLVGNSKGVLTSLDHIDAGLQLSNGDWIVMDGGDKYVLRFTRAGGYVGAFATAKLSRLAVNVVDEVAGLNRDQKSIDFFDATGKLTGRLPFKGTSYDLQSPEDLAYDSFGHLYVLDRTTLAVFSPYGAPGAAPAAAPAGATGRGAAYRLLTTFSEPEKSTTGFHRATSLAIDESGGAYLYDERAERVLVYR